jgi:hypothetical protein
MASAASKQVHRTILFEIPDSNDIQAVLDRYATMAQDAKKVSRTSSPSTYKSCLDLNAFIFIADDYSTINVVVAS